MKFLICYEFDGGFGHGYVNLESLTYDEIENVAIPELLKSVNKNNAHFEAKRLIIRSITKLDE